MILLCGVMASGKTTVGRQLSEALSFSFVDLDAYIESRFQRSIATIFQQDGEAIFRQLEHQALLECLGNSEIDVLSLGGGTVHFDANWQILPKDKICALLVSWQVVKERLQEGNRPLAHQAEILYQERQERLRSIPISIQVDGKEVTAIVAEIISKLELVC